MRCRRDGCDKDAVKGGKFCSRSCSASHNNKGVRRHGSQPRICAGCGRETRNPKFCSLLCQRTHEHNCWIDEWLAGSKTGIRGKNETSTHIRRWLFEKHGSRCQRPDCRWGEVNPVSGKVPLNIEHKDGDWRNNRPENLELLCPNCHSLTPTYGALNKGNNGRKKAKRRKGE